jgi:hypothetical protein
MSAVPNTLYAVVNEQLCSFVILDSMLKFFLRQPLVHLAHWVHV